MTSSSKNELIGGILSSLRSIDADLERVDELAAKRLGINTTDFRCLDLLSRGERLTAGQLARESGLTTGAVTAVVDRLQAAGYVVRERDASDRRRVVVLPTKRALDAVWPLFAGIVAASRAVLARYSAAELALIASFLNANRSAIRRQIERLSEKR